MKGLDFRKADPDEIELMTKARVDFCIRDNPNIDKQAYELFYQEVREWIIDHVSRGLYTGYFGYLSDELVCFAGLLLFEMPPIVNESRRKQGYVLSFFTYPPYRKKGIGNKLMEYMIRDAKEMSLSKLVLIATDDGLPVYRKNGFSEPSLLYMEKRVNNGNH